MSYVMSARLSGMNVFDSVDDDTGLLLGVDVRHQRLSTQHQHKLCQQFDDEQLASIQLTMAVFVTVNQLMWQKRGRLD